MKRTLRLSSVIATVLALFGSLFVGFAGPAQAGTLRNGVCESGEFCYYYNSYQGGSLSDLPVRLANYGNDPSTCYVFKSAGAGRGLCQKNNAASVWNRTGKTIRVHYNSNYGGTYQAIPAGTKRNLNATLKNNNASHRPPPATGTSYPATNNYPYAGATSGVDPWGFYKGQCTSWAAWALRNRLNVPFDNWYKNPYANGRKRWSHAMYWDNVAREVGIPVGTTPRAGAIAVRNSGSFGHVAFVRAVNSDGSFWVEEYNYGGTSRYTHRKTWRKPAGSGSQYFDTFIYFK